MTRARTAAAAAAAAAQPTSCAWHKIDGRLFVVGFADGTIRTWRADTWAEVQALGMPAGLPAGMQHAVTHLSFSRTCALVLACWSSGRTVLFRFDICTSLLHEVPSSAVFWPFGAVTWGEFAPVAPASAPPLVVTCNKLVSVWESDTKSVVWEHSPGAHACCITGDGRMSATATNELLIIHDFRSRAMLRKILMGAIGSMSWAPNLTQTFDGASYSFAAGASEERLLVGRRRSPSYVLHFEGEGSETADAYTFEKRFKKGCEVSTAWTPDGRTALFTVPAGIVVSKDGDYPRMIVVARSPQVTGFAISPDSRAFMALVEPLPGEEGRGSVLVGEL